MKRFERPAKNPYWNYDRCRAKIIKLSQEEIKDLFNKCDTKKEI